MILFQGISRHCLLLLQQPSTEQDTTVYLTRISSRQRGAVREAGGSKSYAPAFLFSGGGRRVVTRKIAFLLSFLLRHAFHGLYIDAASLPSSSFCRRGGSKRRGEALPPHTTGLTEATPSCQPATPSSHTSREIGSICLLSHFSLPHIFKAY